MKKSDRNLLSSIVKNDNFMLIALLAVCIVVFGLLKPRFISLNTLSAIVTMLPEIGLFTLAMMLPMLVGGIDLSIIASANLATVLAGLFMNRFVEKGGDSLVVTLVAIVIIMAVCIFIGFINGFIVAHFQIPAMLVTLGTQMAASGIAVGITRGGTLSGFPKSFLWFGGGTVIGIPTQFWIFAAAVIVLLVIMYKTSFGIKLQMFGSNSTATYFSGIDSKTILIRTHMLSGVYVGIAAILMSSRLTSASAGAAASYLMRTILIAVLGGVDPNGGKGHVSGIIWAVVLFQCMTSGLNIMKVNAYVITAIYGVILLLAVFFNTRSERRG